ncbi:uncharacterized protein ABDE67_012625 [Symphorus nematophorus]
MTHVHYKFSSKLSHDTVVFDGPHITLRDLKRQIMAREKLRAGDCDLQITDAQTKEEYTDNEGLIPKGSSVIVRRIPIIGVKSSSNSKTRHVERSDVQLHHTFGAVKAMDDHSSSGTLPLFSKMANLADADVSEEDKIKVLINQSQYDSMNYNKKFGAVLPVNYTCYRCGNTGHHIRNCPISGDKNVEAPLRLKKSTGIPRSFMVEVDDPNIKGAMLTNCGHYAIPAIHAKAYAIAKKERPPFIPQEQPKSEDKEDPVPDELLCLICHDLLSDAVVIPCCGNSYCDDCIRTALLDSEEHVCPTCNQSDVSPDTLIANKFLRQAVNTFKREQGQAKNLRGRCGTSQSQNPTPTPRPVPTLSPPTMQSQPQKPYQSISSQQVNHTPAVEQPQTVSVNLQQSSSGPAPGQTGSSACWGSSSSSSGCPTGGWSESKNQQLPPSSSSSSSYPATPPPLFPSPHFHTFLAAQQLLHGYPPGYPPATPTWTLPTPQGAPIPSLCSSTSASSIPALIPKEWYMHQRKKKERSPHRGSTYRRSSSRSNSKSSKSKSSRSYSRSSSRSRSRSRSQGRSRPHTTYSRHRDLHTRSHSSHSYSYGYKRSPTPSSSSSPQVEYSSRSKSPSDHRKNSHHSRHHNKKSALSSYSSKRQGECSQREAGGSGGSLASHMYPQHANQTSSLELDRERYLQWKREYKEWCEKYFNSYVGHFHQLPPPLPNLLSWGDREGSRNHSHVNPEFHKQLQGRHAARSSPSQSSSDSRSPPSQSSSDSRSTPSQSSSDSRSSPSHSSNDSRSPPSHLSSDGRSTPSEDGAQPKAHHKRCAEKYSRLPITLTKGSKETELQERNKDDKQFSTKKLENISTLKYEPKSIEKHEKGMGEDSSSPDTADSTEDCKEDKRRQNTVPNACKDGAPTQDKVIASEALKSVHSFGKTDKRLDKDNERKSREQRDLEIEKGWRRGEYSESWQDVERQQKEKLSKGAGMVDADRYRNPGGSKASDVRSEKNRKRKGEEIERSSLKTQSSKCLKTKTAEAPKSRKSESPNPFDRTKPKTEKKKERKAWPLTERDIWEGGIKVQPQKKICININLDGKRKEEKTEKCDSSYLESIIGKTKEDFEKTGNGEEEKSNRGGTEVDEKNEFSRDQKDMSEEKIKSDEGEARPIWEKATFRDDKREMWEKKDDGEKKEDREEEDFDLWHCALRGLEEEKQSKKQWEEQNRMEASKGEEVTNDERRSMGGGKEEERRVRNDDEGQEMVAGTQKESAEGESTCKENRGNPAGELKQKKELMEREKWRMKKEEEDTMIDQYIFDNTDFSNSNSHYEDHRERDLVVKTLEEYTQDVAADGEEELGLIQVPRSKWEKGESEEEERHEGQIKVQTEALAVFLQSSSMSVTAETPTEGETRGEFEQRRRREIERKRDREKEKNDTLSSSHRSVAPSSGKDRPDSTLSTERYWDRDRRMEMERPRDRERGRDSERPRDRQKESKRSRERTREEEKGRDRERKRNPPSSSHPSSSSHSKSHDTERRDRQRGADQGSNKSSCGKSSSARAAELPDQNTNKTCRDMFLDLKFKDRDHPHYYQNPHDPSGTHRHQNRYAGTNPSPPSLSHSRGKERDSLPSQYSGESELTKAKMSNPSWELMQNRSRNESEVEKGVWKRNMVDKVIRERKGERDHQEMLAEREGGSRWEDEADKLDSERPRSNSVSSSASQESGSDDRREEWKRKQKKHKREKQCALELLEEGELKHKHKKSKKCRDGGGEERSGEADDRWKEEGRAL